MTDLESPPPIQRTGPTTLATAIWREPGPAILAIYSQLTANGMAYHSYAINLNVALGTANILFAGLLTSFASQVHDNTKLLLAVVPLLIAGIGILVTGILRKQFYAIASVILTIDESLGVFEVGRFIPGQTLYPLVWSRFGGQRWHEVIFEVFPVFQIFMGLTCAGLVFTR